MSDADALAEICGEVFPPSASVWRAADFTSYAAAATSTVVVARSAGNVCGGAVVQIVPGDPNSEVADAEAELLTIFRAAGSAGSGVGSAILDHILKICAERQVAAIFLEVAATNNRAQLLYQKFDFKRTGVRKGYFPSHKNNRVDAIMMTRCVPTNAE